MRYFSSCPPPPNQVVYTPRLEASGLTTWFLWDNYGPKWSKRLLERGLIFSTKAEAKDAGEKMLQAIGKKSRL